MNSGLLLKFTLSANTAVADTRGLLVSTAAVAWFVPQSLLFTLVMFMLLYCVILAISSTFAWNLTLLDLDLAEVSHVSLVGVRAILCVPRRDELQQYTLLEAPWPDRPKLIPFNPRPFPNREPQVNKMKMFC